MDIIDVLYNAFAKRKRFTINWTSNNNTMEVQYKNGDVYKITAEYCGNVKEGE